MSSLYFSFVNLYDHQIGVLFQQFWFLGLYNHQVEILSTKFDFGFLRFVFSYTQALTFWVYITTHPNQTPNDRLIYQIYGKKGMLLLNVIITLTFLFRDGFHLLILLLWLLKLTILMSNMFGIRIVEQMLLSLPIQQI